MPTMDEVKSDPSSARSPSHANTRANASARTGRYSGLRAMSSSQASSSCINSVLVTTINARVSLASATTSSTEVAAYVTSTEVAAAGVAEPAVLTDASW